MHSLTINKYLVRTNITKIRARLTSKNFSTTLYSSKQDCLDGIRFWKNVSKR